MRGRTRAVLIATVGALVVADVVRSAWLPSGWHLSFNISLAVVVGGLAVVAGLTAAEIGLRQTASGLRWGGAAFAAITTVVVAAALIDPSLFDDDRIDIGAGRMLVKVLFTIPVGTVLVEELAFRGVLLALLRRVTSTRWAVAVSSVLFGLWHVPGAVNSDDGIASIAGIVAGTTVAGLAFCWLRLRSGSLLAPALAHVATNSVVFAVAWTVSR